MPNDWDGYEHRAPKDIGPPEPKPSLGLVNPPTHVSRCACGGEVIATRMTDDELAAAVWAHQTTLGHQAWANRQDAPAFDVPVGDQHDAEG